MSKRNSSFEPTLQEQRQSKEKIFKREKYEIYPQKLAKRRKLALADAELKETSETTKSGRKETSTALRCYTPEHQWHQITRRWVNTS